MLMDLRGERRHRKQGHRIARVHSIAYVSRCNMFAKFSEVSTLFSYLQHLPTAPADKTLLLASINQTQFASNFPITLLSDETAGGWLIGNSERSAGLKYL